MTVLALFEKKFTTIEEAAFIDNKITRLDPESFVELPLLNQTDLSLNKISKIQKKMFTFLKSESILIALYHNSNTSLTAKLS
jgi:Leucine-rich repeat (LRR) protein